jgi:aspartate beta-hydroxylase
LKGWWDRKDFDWILKLEAKAPIIREELLKLRETTGFQPYRSPAYANAKNLAPDVGSLGTDSGNWNIYYLYLHDL